MTLFQADRRIARRLDAKGCRAAIYVDYEGRPYAPPVMLGIRVDGEYRGWIVHTEFTTCRKRHGARQVDAGDHRQVLLQLLNRAQAERRYIVSWSIHDPKWMAGLLSETEQRQLRACYINALNIVRPWHRRTYAQVAGESNSLSYYRRLFGIEVREAYSQVVGVNLAALERRFAAGEAYSDLDPDARKLWRAVVRHNQFDLQHMQVIIQKILTAR